MRIVIASDIHGSSGDCRLLLKAYEREGARRLILLGDILYHGPRNDLPRTYAPKEVIAMLNPLAGEILCVRGNCDAEVDQMVLDFPVLTEHRVTELFGRRFFLTHGHHCNYEKLPGPELLQGAQWLLYGHTHVPLNALRQGIHCLNPGSVSIPKNGSWKGYMCMDEAGIRWKNLAGETKMSLPWPETSEAPAP